MSAPPTAKIALRYDDVTATVKVAACLRCGRSLPAAGGRRWCSDACRQSAYRARRAAPPPVRERCAPAQTVYECPACEQRYLGPTRRCEDCNLCRRVGPGGLCPHCDQPVAHEDLQP